MPTSRIHQSCSPDDDAIGCGADVAYGQRLQRKGKSRFKRASAAFFYRLLQRLADAPIPSDTGDFRLMKRNVVDILLSMPEQHRFIRGMVAWIGFRQVAVPYHREPALPARRNIRCAR